MAHIKPEHLLEPRDYRQWVKVHTDSSGASASTDDGGTAADDVLFESLSKRAWMDVLLQLVKVSMLVHSVRSLARSLMHIHGQVILEFRVI